MLGLFTIHGAGFLGIKLDGDLKEKAKTSGQQNLDTLLSPGCVFLVWTYLATDILNNPGYDGLIPALLAAVALLAYGWFQRQGKEGLYLHSRRFGDHVCNDNGLFRSLPADIDLDAGSS